MPASRPSKSEPRARRTGRREKAGERGLRERKKRKTRERLAAEAWRLVGAHGFERVTVDEIAAAADVSRSTFFRYFASKEAVLFTWRARLLEAFEAELARDPGAAESGFEKVRRALGAVGELYQRDRAEIVPRQQAINASPTLVGYEYEVDRAWEDAIARTLLGPGTRGAGAKRDAELRAGAILGVLRVTLRHWIASRGRTDLVKSGQDALAWLAPPVREFRPPRRTPRTVRRRG